MPINPGAVGSKGAPEHSSWTSKDALLYALGVGAGAEDALSELAFTTENSHGIDQQVLPTMAVVLGSTGGGEAYASIGTYDSAMLVHAEQAITLHGPLPVEGEAETTTEVTAIYDKGKAALIEFTSTSVDARTGAPLFATVSSVFIRGEGGFGGERGPSGGQSEPVTRAPDHSVTYQIRGDQALLYRLSGDRNPLHSDPTFARAGGFDRPILHGLCTYGFTGRALLHTLCDSDPARFRSMQGRFTSPVYPGEAITVKMWKTADTEALFETTGQDGRTVLAGKLTTTE
ncbi:MAG: Enoyl-CoA hydratase [Acidimicrobiia bacterium]|nr:Enoyl-CoA hydratase [Acidimicrobiia bacterium]